MRASRAPIQVTSTTNSPGSATCWASSSDRTLATSTAAARTSCDASGSAGGTGPRRRCRAARAGRRRCRRRARSRARAGGAGRTRALERPDQRTDREAEQRDADEHDDAEEDRGAQQDRRDGEERDDRAGEAGEHVEGAADLLDVAARDGDDLAGGDVPAQLVPEVGGVARDELLGAARRGDPVRDGHPVAQDAGAAETVPSNGDDRDGPQHAALVAVGRGLDAGAERGGDGGHRDHPDDAPGDAQGQGAPLLPRHPPQVGGGRAKVGCPRVREGEAGE